MKEFMLTINQILGIFKIKYQIIMIDNNSSKIIKKYKKCKLLIPNLNSIHKWLILSSRCINLKSRKIFIQKIIQQDSLRLLNLLLKITRNIIKIHNIIHKFQKILKLTCNCNNFNQIIFSKKSKVQKHN